MSLIEAGLVKSGLVRAGLVRAIRVAGERFFRRNEGTTDYATAPDVTLNDDRTFKFVISTTEGSGDRTILSLFTDTIGEFFQIGIRSGNLKVFTDGDTTGQGSINLADGKLHRVVLNVGINGSITSTIDGISDYSVTHTTPSKLLGTFHMVIYAKQDIDAGSVSANIEAIVADIGISENSTPIRGYAIDDNSDTIKDSIGGFDGTVINGNVDDWGLFYRDGNKFVGDGLEVPPWDSVNQELIIA